MNRTTLPPAVPIAVQLGRWVENNLTAFATQAMREISRPENADQQGEILTAGISILKARQDVRAGLRTIQRGLHGR
jgi:hypothetical protein